MAGPISASLSTSSASKQTTATDTAQEVGRLTFGTKKDNTLLYIVGGVIALVAIIRIFK